jgi:hypothetical protein
MSLFRPAAKVTTPDGREWEIYAYKIKVGDLDDFGPTEDDALQGQADLEIASLVVIFVINVLLLIPRLLIRAAQVAVGAIRSVRSDQWTIDAVTFMPRHTVYTWTTTTEYKGQVLAQVEGHLARGDVPHHLTNAVYRGERRSAR